jgi:hypothetical protein
MSTLAQLERRLEEAEGQIQKLEGPQDSITSNAFAIGPAGQIEENLTGKLTAEGIIFEQGSKIGEGGIVQPGSEEKSEIVWSEEGGGAVASITSFNFAAKPPGTKASSQLQALISKGAVEAGIEAVLHTNPIVGQAVIAAAGATGAPDTVTLISSVGGSSFVQLGAGLPAKVVLTYGEGEIEWAAKGKTSKNLKIATGLTILHIPMAFSRAGSVNFGVFVEGAEISTTAEADVELAAGSRVPFYWAALGS